MQEKDPETKKSKYQHGQVLGIQLPDGIDEGIYFINDFSLIRDSRNLCERLEVRINQQTDISISHLA